MSNPFDDPIARSSVRSASIDAGLRSYMLGIYNYMATGLALTGVVAYLFSTQIQLMHALFSNALLGYAIIFSPFILVFLISAKLNSYNVSTLRSLFIGYAFLMGVSLSTIFLVYTGESIAKTFFITSSMFLSMSIYGYTTKKDLTNFGSFLIMGVWGLIIASVVNMFVGSGPLSLAISALTVVIFTGLTAYDSQMLKEMYHSHDSEDVVARKTIFGALSLYIDFVNIFLALLRLFGDRR